MPGSGRWQKAERGEPAVGTPAAHEAVMTMPACSRLGPQAVITALFMHLS